MDSRKAKSDLKSNDVAYSDCEFSFQPEIGGSSRGQGFIRLGPRARRSGTPTCTSRKEEGSFKPQRSPSPIASKELWEGGLPQTS